MPHSSADRDIIHVLFVNDRREACLPIIELMRQFQGFECDVTWCEEHSLALEAMLAPVHDVILLDFFSAPDRARELLQSAAQHHCKTPIICLADHNDFELEREAIKLGASDFLPIQALESAQFERAMRYAIDRRQAQQELTKLAHYDVLTGIPNRSLFSDRLDRALQRSSRGDKPFALFFVDLDGFKSINDTHGHEVGDAVVVEIARRLSGSIRRTDTVARIGGDEFTVLVEKVGSIGDAVTSAEKIIDVVTQPLELNGRALWVGCSIGIAVYPDAGQDAATLMRHADTAMYEAKAMAGSNYRFYSEKMNIEADEQSRLENSLLRAIQEEELRLYYQPRISLRTGKIVGAEALLRWEHPERGVVAPAEFLPVAERSDLLSLIGNWSLDRLCADIESMDSRHMAPIRFSLNVGFRQFHDADFVYAVESILAKYKVSPERIDFELAEQEVSARLDEIADAMRLLHAKGFQFSLDDFGNGLTALSRMHALPFSSIKLAAETISEVPGNKSAEDITRAMIQLAHNFGMQIIAKGVESAEQRSYLSEHRCDQLQGYVYSPPLPSDDFFTFLQKEGATSRRSYLSVVDSPRESR